MRSVVVVLVIVTAIELFAIGMLLGEIIWPYN